MLQVTQQVLGMTVISPGMPQPPPPLKKKEKVVSRTTVPLLSDNAINTPRDSRRPPLERYNQVIHPSLTKRNSRDNIIQNNQTELQSAIQKPAPLQHPRLQKIKSENNALHSNSIMMAGGNLSDSIRADESGSQKTTIRPPAQLNRARSLYISSPVDLLDSKTVNSPVSVIGDNTVTSKESKESKNSGEGQENKDFAKQHESESEADRVSPPPRPQLRVSPLMQRGLEALEDSKTF